MKITTEGNHEETNTLLLGRTPPKKNKKTHTYFLLTELPRNWFLKRKCYSFVHEN